jgi:hypothetical protein
LLVSVRSAEEARSAFEGGATVIDVKEPSHGPLGRASAETWRSVRDVIPSHVAVSVALGELVDWDGGDVDWRGLAYRKLGLAGTGRDWAGRWAEVRRRSPGPPWIAVAYADWRIAQSPRPEEVVEVASTVPECAGLLIDTCDKSRPGGLDLSWSYLIERMKTAGRLVALAGRLDIEAIRRLGPLGPDLFAVRGAACLGGDRLGAIDRRRVAELARAVTGSGASRPAAS